MLELKGQQGKTLTVDDNFVEFRQKSSGKKIPIKNISSVELNKQRGGGYIQIAEIGTNKNKGFTSGLLQATFDENSILFGWSDSDYALAKQIKKFIEDRMIELTNQTVASTSLSPADELVKYKALLDQGILTPEEFAAKKKQLLNL